MDFDLFDFILLVPAYIGAPFLAGVNFIQSHALPWAVGAFFATLIQTYKPPMTRTRALLNAALFIAVGIVLMPMMAIVFAHFFRSEMNLVFGLSVLAAYGVAWLIFAGKK
jgi:hypothetical protein